jgi:predicted Rossmann fold flavoprotein
MPDPGKRIVIAGSGAAGLMAAGSAVGDVTVLEKMPRPGMKLAITGKGRCNLTNIAPLDVFLSHFGPNGRFLKFAFSEFFSRELISLLESLGVPVVTERGGRVFPVSNEAGDVVDALVRRAQKNGARFRLKTKVKRLVVQDGRVAGVEIDRPDGPEFIPADSVILACGGLSYSGTGSTGDGFAMAKAAGHTIIPTRPALVPLVTVQDTKPIQGLALKNVRVTLWVAGKKTADDFGEMLFTHFGLSGPIILSLSRAAVDGLSAKHLVQISIDLKPALDEKKLDARLLRDLEASGKKRVENIFKDLLPASLIPVALDATRIPADKPGHQVKSEERKRLRVWLKDFRFDVAGHRGYSEAIITAGGVSLREVDPKTMQSKLIRGLYFAGETLDLDADTGGYNLQAAFSTGRLAGLAASIYDG